MVDAYIARDANGVCRIFVKRAKHKWWFELGKHEETDKRFEEALSRGQIRWRDKIEGSMILFR